MARGEGTLISSAIQIVGGGSLYVEIPVIHTVVSENSNHFVQEEKFVWLKPLVSAGYQYRAGNIALSKAILCTFGTARIKTKTSKSDVS